MIKEEAHVFKGMTKDVDHSKHSAELLWDALNIRIVSIESGTSLSITNEKGNEQILEFDGICKGYCVANDYLVLFTSGDDDKIYRVDKNYNVLLLHNGNLNFGDNIETLYDYETENIQKVYWVDGINQPRFINIMKHDYTDNSFDFVQTLNLRETVEVERYIGNGFFAPGVIQYAFTYYNKYGSESKIFYTTHLEYVALNDRGENPEKTVSNCFKVTISNVDRNFEYIRVYSIHRTSIDAVPITRIVTDLELSNDNTVSFIDTGAIGETVDNKKLMFLGGIKFVPSTLVAKDGTMFMGDLKLEHNNIESIESIFSDINNTDSMNLSNLDDNWEAVTEQQNLDFSIGDYVYETKGIQKNTARFKTNEYYRLGVQCQYEDGEWSEPIVLKKEQVITDSYPWIDSTKITLKTLRFNIPSEYSTRLVNEGIKRVRTCIVLPNTLDRSVIAQGILCPTVFTASARHNNSPYVQSSWFFRPIHSNDNSVNTYNGGYKGFDIQYKHRHSLYGHDTFGGEIQGQEYEGIYTGEPSFKNSDTAYVDSNIVTFHSPDIEFDQMVSSRDMTDTKLKIVGAAFLTSSKGDCYITTNSGPLAGVGYVKSQYGYSNTDRNKGSGGTVTIPAYYDYAIKAKHFSSDMAIDDRKQGTLPLFWPVYPWHRSGSLNNDSKEYSNGTTQTALLKNKILSNLKFFGYNVSLSMEDDIYNIIAPQIFNSDYISQIKLNVPWIDKKINYYGNVDTLLSPASHYKNSTYKLYYVDTSVIDSSPNFGTITELPETVSGSTDKTIKESADPVRMTYRSTPHLMFSLGETDGIPNILPQEGSGQVFNYYERIAIIVNNITDEDTLGKIKGLGLSVFKDTPGVYLYDSTTKFFYRRTEVKSIDNDSLIIGSYSTYLWEYMMFYPLTDKTIFTIEKEFTRIIHPVDIYDPNSETTETVTGQELSIYTGPTRAVCVKNIGEGYNRTLCKYNSLEESAYQRGLNLHDIPDCPYLLIGELIRNKVDNRFGGDSRIDIQKNTWIPASDPVDVEEGEVTSIIYQYGDTWYQRYDCLKTYPYTDMDLNSIVEIGSFLCETRVNIDGRYDKNRGLSSNTAVSPTNFNKINEVYSQRNNFFNYKKMNPDFYKTVHFGNQITWSLEKTPASEIDNWTQMSLANTLNFEGKYGKISALRLINDTVFAFQDHAISKVAFNNRVQIPVSDGVPIEITNGYKVEGKLVMIEDTGVQSSLCVATSPAGIYFVDNSKHSAYLFSDKLADLGEQCGMTSWFKNKIIKSVFYDRLNKDVYFLTDETALCFNENIGQFTSMFDYHESKFMFAWNGSFYSIYNSENASLWKNRVKDNTEIFNTPRGFNFSFISNDNPTYTKVFDTIEYRADFWEDGLSDKSFDYIQASNEYQDTGEVEMSTVRSARERILKTSLRPKFRAWRAQIPRVGRQRIRNPWTMIKLGCFPGNNSRIQLHDITVKYTI